MEPAAKLNDELLKEAQATEKTEDTEPKRNTKDDLIAKIINCCADNELELEVSNTKLRRMPKQELCKLLAQKIEEGIKVQMARQVGVKKGSSDGVIALGALKMIHNIVATTAERGLNLVLPNYGYEVVGFTKALKDPNVDEAVDQCLEEIAAESDILQYIESPYTRLAIAWGGALVTTIKRKQPILRNHVANVGPVPPKKEDTVQPRARRRAPPGKVHSNLRPVVEDEKQV